MSRTLTLLATVLALLAAYLLFHHYSNDSTLIPSPTVTTTAKALPTTQEDPNFHDWREFSFKSERFKVLLPSLPQHVSDTVIDPKTLEPRKFETFATVGDNGAAFMINAITFSKQKEEEASEESLKTVVNDMMDRNKENQLNEMRMSTFHGSPALDFSLSNGERLIQGKVIAHKKTMYILSMINKKETFNKQELEFFINSFEFVDDKDELISK